ncbi:MAG: hypothetical protein HOE90_21330 [Bacteriovoracaceae bacterium]|jgi:hypothetical protein|nr:hypothetical protein [Bacteriovoracaceae bacterium]
MRYFLLIILFCSMGPTSSANTFICSNALQSFSYNHFASNGGANRNSIDISYNGVMARRWNHRGAAIIFNLTDQTVSHTRSIPAGGTVTNYAAKASGEFTKDGKLITFKDIWIICEQTTYPLCDRCP